MTDTELILGEADMVDRTELYKLRTIYFPVGKIGGYPAWLNPVQVPQAKDVQCRLCGKPMAFVIQLYAPNRADNFQAIRVQLPLQNPYYDSKPLDNFVEVEERREFDNGETAANLCATCGLKASSKCGKCQKVWYCSREHQILDWNQGSHKTKCGRTENETADDNSEVVDESKIFSTSTKIAPAPNPFLFRAYGLKLVHSYMSKADLVDLKKDSAENDATEDDDEDSELTDEDDERFETYDFKREQEEQLEQLEEKLKSNEFTPETASDLMDTIRNDSQDRYFERFLRVINQNPNQVLRYVRHKAPLRPSDHTPLATEIPNCTCGSPRTFEFQLMPRLLSLMEVDLVEASIDWSTVCIYTCSVSCPMSDRGFANEFVTKHDFLPNHVVLSTKAKKE